MTDRPSRTARLRVRLAAVPRGVLAVTALFGLVLALWTVAVPQYRAPDEPAHVDLILFLAEGHPYPQFDGRFFGKEVGLATQRHLIELGKPWPRFAADDAPPRSNRPNVEDLGGTGPDPGARKTIGPGPPPAGAPYVYNQMPQHPPLYHQAMAAVLRLERAVVPGSRTPPLDREIGLLRLVNALLLTPLPFLAWAAARRTGSSQRAAQVASVLPLGLPQLTHIGSSANNDNLLTLLAAVLAVLLAGVGRGRRTIRTDVTVGVVFGLAMLTKAFALALLPWIVAAYVLAWLAAPDRRKALAGLMTAGLITAVVGAWWWIGNLIRHGEPAPTSETLTRTRDRRPDGFEPDAWSYAWRFTTRMASRTWAWVGFGTPKVMLPGVITAVLTLLTVAVVVLALIRSTPGADRTRGPRRRDLLLALLPVTALLTFVARRAWGLHVTTGTFAFVQGRYLFAGIVPLVVVAAIGYNRLLGRRGPGVLLAVAATLQFWMLQRVVSASWAGHGFLGRAGSMLAWSPWPSAAVVLVAGGAVAALAVAARWLIVEPTGELDKPAAP